MPDRAPLDMLRAQLTELLDTVAGPDPAGTAVLTEGMVHRLRELRREDDASPPMGGWVHDLKRADWSRVEYLSIDLLKHGKDLQVAAWLGEAWVHRYELNGLCAALELLAGLGETYGKQLYPRCEGEDYERLGMILEWVARIYSQFLVSRIPLFPVSEEQTPAPTAADFFQLQRRMMISGEARQAQQASREMCGQLQAWQAAVAQVRPQAFAEDLTRVHTCLAAVQRLEDWTKSLLGEQAPSLRVLQQALEQRALLQSNWMAQFTPPGPAPLPVEQSSTPVTASTTPPPIDTSRSAPSSREEAYARLAVIADYLAHSEPHSPVPYLLRQGLHWGSLPLPELLEHLARSSIELQTLWSALGVYPRQEPPQP